MKTRLALIWILAFALTACGIFKAGNTDQVAPLDNNSTDTSLALPTYTALATPAPGRQQFQLQAVTGDVAAEPLVESEAVGGVSGVVAQAPPASRDGTTANTIPPTPDAMQFDNPGTNPFLDTADDHLSTFAMDVDTASYTVARNYLLTQNQYPPDEAIRPEEFINYFDAGYDSPGSNDAFAIYMDAAPTPFGYEGHYLLRVGIQAKYIAPEDRDPALLIFVIDVSGSMDREDRLGTVKESLDILLGELREDDRVGIVVYSNQSRSILDPTPASNRQRIQSAIDALRPEGSTNVEDGLRLGYQMAEEYMREGEITRVITLSDGVGNVGNTGPEAILRTISSGVDKGVTLSTIGFGMGNYNDVLMEQLANNGNGNYYYVDTLREARRIFVHNLTGTLQVVGYDAKIQVDFNPEVTDRYRLIGYENRAIADQDFRNDTVDAGEVGAGHSVTALYEIALQDEADLSGVVATTYIRYEDADTREVVEINRAIEVDDLLDSLDDAPATFRLQMTVAEFAELLRGSFWAEGGNYGEVLRLAQPLAEEFPEDEDVTEFVQLVEAAIRYSDR